MAKEEKGDKVVEMDMPPLPKNMKIHPFAQTFAILTGQERDDLSADIKANGVVVPIVVNKKRDTIIDGRNRWMIATELGVQKDVPYDVFQGTDEEIPSEILRLNVFRRHLDDDQRLAYIVKIRGPILEKEGKKKQAEGAKGFKSKGDGQTSVSQLAKEGKTTEYKAQQMEKARKAGLIDDVIQKKLTPAQAASKAGSKKRTSTPKVLTFEEEVWAYWKRLVNHWPQTQHRDVFKMVTKFIDERRSVVSEAKSTEKAPAKAPATEAPAKKPAAKTGKTGKSGVTPAKK